MTSMQRVLRPFIEDGSVSINSHSDDDVDFLYSVRGADFSRDNMKIFQVKKCSKRLEFNCLSFSYCSLVFLTIFLNFILFMSFCPFTILLCFLLFSVYYSVLFFSILKTFYPLHLIPYFFPL